MTTYSISAPDGNTYTIEGPEGASQEQVKQEVIRQNPQLASTPAAEVPPTAAVTAPEPPSMLNQLGRQAGLTARAGITGITAVPAMFADFLTGAGGLATGRAIKPSSQALQEFMTQAGLPEPQGTLERAVQAGAGAMAGTGVQAAASQGIPALSAFTANLPQQVAAAGAGGVAGQSVSEGATAVTGSPLAGVAAGLVAGTLGGAAASKAAARTGKLPTSSVTIEDIKNRATQSYKAVENLGVAVKPKSVLDMLNNAENTLVKGNFNPLIDTHKPVAQVLNQLRAMTGTQRVSFTKLEQMRAAAGGLKTANDAATRKFAGDLVDEIDNYIGSLKGNDLIAGQAGLSKAVSSVQSARKDWRNMSKATILEDALNVTEARQLDAKASENELIRRQLINLVANKKKIKQFSEAEQNAIKSVARGGKGDPILSLIARFNPERSQLVATGSAFGAALNPLSMAVPAAGFAADKYLGMSRGAALRGLVSDVAGGTLRPQQPEYGWRGTLANLPTQEEMQ